MLAWLESGTAAPASKPVDLADIVREVAEDAAFEAKSRGREVQVAETCDAVVLGDPELLHSAVENVVRNAVRHTREGTTVAVGMRRDAHAAPSCIRIWVRDHGGGVPDEALPYIFQPFYRGGDARDRGTGGVGLGLTIVHRTVQLHGRAVRAAHAPPGRLPRAPRPPRSGHMWAATPPPHPP